MTKAPKPPAPKVAPRLLAGGNPQIARAQGDAPVQAWIAAAPGWKGPAAAEIDSLVTGLLPGVAKAVKWNSPLYGLDSGRWFLGLHAMTGYLKLAFFDGAALQPPPPVGSRQPLVRYLHVSPGAPLDRAQFAAWIAQVQHLPGARM